MLLILFLTTVLSSNFYAQTAAPVSAPTPGSASKKNWQKGNFIDSKGEKKEVEFIYGFQADTTSGSPKGPKTDDVKVGFMPAAKASDSAAFGAKPAAAEPTPEAATENTNADLNNRLEQLKKMIKQ